MSHVCTREINTKHVKTKTVDLGYRKIQVQLALIGMRVDAFISLSFLDQSLSAEFSSKISKLFWR